MSFAFGFAGDDIEADDHDMLDAEPEGEASAKAAQDLVLPKMHTLADLLSNLPSQISYNTLSIPPHPSNTIARRSLFDIRQQLMAESSSANSNDALIANLSSGDLSSGTYEGGFKTWECALDLASLLSDPSFAGPTTPGDKDNTPLHVIELGAGSAIPSLAVLRQCLSADTHTSPLNLTLCDYNEDVLKLCTAPNVFLNCHLIQQQQSIPETNAPERDHDLDLEPLTTSIPCLAETLKTANDIDVAFVSGAWGPSFFSLLKSSLAPTSTTDQQPPPTRILILASETIYSPATLPDFVGTTISLLSLGAEGSRALVAAKKVYFGVGGGVAEFEREVAERGAGVRTVWHSGDEGGVGRVVLEVSLQR
ncbi:uncharacterized protein HMPREF1541_07878 [Cyphellophora europaea CBS 101466]|uniref:protein-histidine N-methyltransferase n=1 Tax=Cyphellophora europaea (strain CBS 101466) TaxID=1220924 RepID=W2RKB2_CYPE1|nr:uncharacterized protein HMPREF1541_07878 [Cyphellophora europaea CBS 101466]ETN36891.1 hypothetical protein HMPREF1541_07878 [Cyphellophora europaea CBS 101466]